MRDYAPQAAAARLRIVDALLAVFQRRGFARVDHHRPLRQGMPEAVYGPGKTPEQCVAIVGELLQGGDDPVEGGAGHRWLADRGQQPR